MPLKKTGFFICGAALAAMVMIGGCGSRPKGMRLIPGGMFQMGSTLFSDAKPMHSVTVSAFYMDTTLVTQDEYLLLTKSNPSRFVHERHPVEKVTWYDAVLFCNARSKRDHRDTVYTYNSIVGRNEGGGVTGLWGLAVDMKKNGYRLPTEAEYEYANRAGSTAEYYWGGNYPPLTAADTAAINVNAVWNRRMHYKMLPGSGGILTQDTTSYGTEQVASRKPNAWGLYDMSGNLWEWCNDWYDSTYYRSGPMTDPTGPATGSYRVLRGGSWGDIYYDALYLCAAYRYGGVYPENEDPYSGFRVVCGPR